MTIDSEAVFGQLVGGAEGNPAEVSFTPCQNRWDLSWCQNRVIESNNLTIGGRLFQILREAALNTQDAVTVLVLGMTRSVTSEWSDPVGM